MCIAVVGKETPGTSQWRKTAAGAGFDLRMVQPPLVSSIAHMDGVDALLILTGGVTAEEQEQAVEIASRKGIPSLCATCEGAIFCR